MPLPLLPLAIAAGAAWLATRKPPRATQPPPKGGDGNGTSNGGDNPVGGGVQAGTGTIGPSSKPGAGDTTVDSNGNIVADDFMANNTVVNGPTFRAQFIEEVWEPAAAVKLEDLTADDIADAFTFLSGGSPIGSAGKFGRRDELGSLYRAALADIAAQETGKETAGIVGAIESVIPYMGAAMGAANNAAITALNGSEASTVQGLSTIVATTVSPQSLTSSPLARAIMAPSCQLDAAALKGDGEDPLTREEMQSPTALMGVPGYDGFGWEGRRWVHARLLTRTPYGWMFPWLCNWFDGLPNNAQGSGQTIVSVSERRKRRARVFRAIDLLIAKRNAQLGLLPQIEMFLGAPSLAHQPGAPGGYWYHNDNFGDLYAACLPPARMDLARGELSLWNPVDGPDDYLTDAQGNRRTLHGSWANFVPDRAYQKKLALAENPPGGSGPVVVVPKAPGSIEGDNVPTAGTGPDPYGLVAAYVQAHNDEPPLTLAQQWLAAGQITQDMYDEIKEIFDKRASDAAAAAAAAARAAALKAQQEQAAQAVAAAARQAQPLGTVGPSPNRTPPSPFGNGTVKGLRGVVDKPDPPTLRTRKQRGAI